MNLFQRPILLCTAPGSLLATDRSKAVVLA